MNIVIDCIGTFSPKQFKKIRLFFGISCLELSSMTHIIFEDILMYENGTKIPTKEDIEKISRLYNIPTRIFYTPKQVSTTISDKETIVEAIKRLEKETWKKEQLKTLKTYKRLRMLSILLKWLKRILNIGLIGIFILKVIPNINIITNYFNVTPIVIFIFFGGILAGIQLLFDKLDENFCFVQSRMYEFKGGGETDDIFTNLFDDFTWY